ncbi:MAG: hypothetical protein NZT61_03055 [Deltaproteobacteria bacterium]|nr:hypothetical protein [Deltaproteobacteria bacterium]MCX7953305.1 hypothetical protein [Deltaproteobacteria bacterium]
MNNSNNREDGGLLSASERKLLLAVLQKAVYDYVFGEGEIKESAKQWLFNDDYDANLRFAFVCDCLGLNSSALRQRLKKLTLTNEVNLGESLA